ncbi:MAG: SGNH/GDSL hydrolase family protein [Clostridia bacterium]|nr:SGNH/GDSL hydrolase family protein [Clostridia bacterium]
MQSALQNSYKLLKHKNRLTIGYFGGSITCGGSAKHIIEKGRKVPEKQGTIADSYVNRTSAWIKKLFPNAEIETVNAGVSDTHTQLGLYRLEGTLMNTNGHNMPDLVFIEFTSNDWVYGEHTVQIIKAELESLIINIRKINPFADIVIIATNTLEMQNCPKKLAHKEIADYYSLPFIDVGAALQNAKETDPESAHTESGEKGTLKYTVDDLHPSALGYAVYLEEIKKVLSPHLDGENCGHGIIDHTKSAPTPLSKELYIPRIIDVDDITAPADAEIAQKPLCVQLHGTLLDDIYHYHVVKNCIVLKQNETITAEFAGGVLGILVAMQSKTDVGILYRIDGGEWLEFSINDSQLGFQRYPHTQAFFLKAGLSKGKHTVTLKSVAEKPLIFGAFLAQ